MPIGLLKWCLEYARGAKKELGACSLLSVKGSGGIQD